MRLPLVERLVGGGYTHPAVEECQQEVVTVLIKDRYGCRLRVGRRILWVEWLYLLEVILIDRGQG